MKKHFFLYVGAGAAIVLLFLEIKNGFTDDHYQMVAEKGQMVADQAGDFIEKIRNSIISVGDDDMFEPLNMERFKLPDGSLTGEEMFVWYAFYDLRDPQGPRIRILANVVCKDLKKADILVELGDNQPPLALDWAEVLGSAGCPGGGGGHCRLQEMDLSTVVYRGMVPDEITVIRKAKSAKVKLHKMPVDYEDQINSCIIAPLFWYNDWPRLFLFFEWWKRNRINKILMHVQSISKTTKKVLDYYIDQGLLEVRPFPMMPYTMQYNPNNHVYYSAEHLTTFFCGVWSDTKYTTMNDVDEIFYVRNRSETLLDVARRLMDPVKYPDIGAIWLEHNALGFPGGISPNPWSFEQFRRFDFVKTAHPFQQGRAGKYIYQTQYAKLPWIHGMRHFYANKRDEMIPKEQAIYLHMRNDMGNVDAVPRIFPDFEMFEDNAIPEMGLILGEIFDKEPPMFKWRDTAPVVGDCVQRALAEIPGQDCIKPTGPTCYAALKDLDEWLYAIPNEDSEFIAI